MVFSSELQESGLGTILRALNKHKRTVALTVIAAVIAALAFFVFVPNEYRASTQILVVIEKPQILGPDAQSLDGDLSRFMIGPVIDSQVEIIRSQGMARQVIAELQLEEHPRFAKESGGPLNIVRDAVRGAIGFLKSLFSEPVETVGEATDQDSISPAIVRRFQDGLDVRRKGLTLILEVSFTDEDPTLAANAANTLARLYLDQQQNSRRDVSGLLSVQLGQRVDELRGQLVEREEFLQEYIKEHQLALVGGLTISEREISETISALVDARATTAEAEAQLEYATRLSAAPEIINNAKYDYDIASQKVKVLQRRLQELTEESAEKNWLNIRRAELEREVRATSELYSALLLRLKETLVQGSILFPEARIIDRASLPYLPTGPGKAFLLLVALMGGLLLGATLALLQDQIETKGSGESEEEGKKLEPFV